MQQQSGEDSSPDHTLQNEQLSRSTQLAELKARLQTNQFDMSELRGLCNEIIVE